MTTVARAFVILGDMSAMHSQEVGIVAGATARVSAGTGRLDAVNAFESGALGVLLAATIASRLFTRSRYLFNWDSIQYALGVQRFDLVAHRPHPPGYLGYIVLGRAFTALLGGDPERGLVVLSAVAEALAVLLIFLAARASWGRFAGWVAALLFATSPLTWIYGSVALNYSVEPVFVIAVTWACLRACSGDRRALVAAAVMTAIAGAIRPTDELFLLAPMGWAGWRTWQQSGRAWVLAAAAAGMLVSLAWVGPLLAMSGGVGTYLRASQELSARASDTSAVWKAGLAGLRLNGTAVIAGLVTALGLVVPLGVTYLLCRAIPALRGGTQGVGRDYRALAGATLVPALAIYVLVHIGQLGYLLLLLPALVLPGGVVLASLARIVSPRREIPLRNAMLGLCVVTNVAIFALPAGGMRDQVVEHDRYVTTFLELIRRYDPATTTLITSAEADGSYRLVQYYLQQYPFVAIGRDQRKHAGEVFAAGGRRPWGSAPEYDLARFKHAAAVDLPPSTRTVLVLDRGAMDLVGDRSQASVVLFGDNWRMWSLGSAVPVTPEAAGRFVYLDPADCPCQGGGVTLPLPVPHRPL
ncbi:MAG: hypothetical protein NVSMB17_16780 [Candidatus Dormibacteria bacterium]